MGKKRRQGAPGGSRGAPTHRKSDPGPTFSSGDRSVLRGTPKGGASDPGPARSQGLYWSLAIAAAAVLVYLNAFGHEFVLDDTRIIRDNVRIRSLANIPELFRSSYWGIAGAQSLYRPLALVTYAFNYAAHGLSTSGFTAVNVALHAAVSVPALRARPHAWEQHGRSPASRGLRLPSIPCTRKP